MRQGTRRFIWTGMIVLAAAVVITLCRAQDEEDAALPPMDDEEATLGAGSAAEEFIIQSLLPDLRVHSVSAPGSASPGSVISVSDVTTNTGNAFAAQSKSDIYICTDVNNVTSACWVTNHIVAGIGPGRSTTWSGSLTVPANQPVGTNYYIVVTNGNRQVLESSFANNTNYVM